MQRINVNNDVFYYLSRNYLSLVDISQLAQVSRAESDRASYHYNQPEVLLNKLDALSVGQLSNILSIKRKVIYNYCYAIILNCIDTDNDVYIAAQILRALTMRFHTYNDVISSSGAFVQMQSYLETHHFNLSLQKSIQFFTALCERYLSYQYGKDDENSAASLSQLGMRQLELDCKQPFILDKDDQTTYYKNLSGTDLSILQADAKQLEHANLSFCRYFSFSLQQNIIFGAKYSADQSLYYLINLYFFNYRLPSHVDFFSECSDEKNDPCFALDLYANILIGKDPAYWHSSVHDRNSKEVYQLKLISCCNDCQCDPELINRAENNYDELILSFLHIVQPIILNQLISLIDNIITSASAKAGMTYLSNAYHHRFFTTTLTMSKPSLLMRSASSFFTKKPFETESQNMIRTKFDTYKHKLLPG